jgi:general secretion pathway protein A
MYAKYFGLAEMPFRITPDPRFLWYSDQHQEAKQKIIYHINESVGPIYLLADIGTGKTTIARRIVEELSPDKRKSVVFIASPKLTTPNAFLRVIMDQFEVPTARSYAQSLKNFENFLTDQYTKSISPVLLIDEAQNMTRDMLILIQHLFNFSTNTAFLVQMVMFGQPDLQPKLDKLESLKSRLNVAKLKPFDLKQTKQMMKFRWQVAGGKKFPFSDEAVKEIFKRTNGIPRSIVKLADESLVKTAVDSKHTVTREAVVAAHSEITVNSI